MINISNTKTFNFEGAIRGMRNPMNSWDKSDSHWDDLDYLDKYVIGNNDMVLAKKLINAGSDHRKFIRQMFISVDIEAPLYWWKEFDTYKVGTVANSCSTMHKIHDKEFTFNDFSIEHLSAIDIGEGVGSTYEFFRKLIRILNECRELFLQTKDKIYWWQMIQLLPSSYNQLRTVTLNYENVLNMYKARKNHKLDEWHTFCDWVETLPYFKEFFLDGGNCEKT